MPTFEPSRIPSRNEENSRFAKSRAEGMGAKKNWGRTFNRIETKSNNALFLDRISLLQKGDLQRMDTKIGKLTKLVRKYEMDRAVQPFDARTKNQRNKSWHLL